MRQAPSGSLHRRVALALVVCLAIGLPYLAWAQLPVSTYLLQNAATGNSDGLVAHAAGFGLANVQIAHPAGATPTFTATFEQSANDTHYVATLCQPVGGTALASTATATGQWRCNVAGALWFRTRISGYSGPGAITAIATLLGGNPVLGLAENAPQGSQTVNQGGTWTIQAAHQGGTWTLAHVTSVTHVAGVVDRPSYTNFHLFSTIGLSGTASFTSGPAKAYAIQAAITRGTSASWYVHLQVSLDGNSFTSIVKHEQSSGDGQAVFSGTTFYPARYLRAHVTGFSGDGLLWVHVLGMS